MQNEFVPYESAFKLKQLGFNEKCFCNWEESWSPEPEDEIRMVLTTDQTWLRPGWIRAPLFQQAFRWFREKYGLQYDITFTANKELIGFYVLIHKLDGLVFNEDDSVEIDIQTTNREETELIILDKMIEIVETKQQEQ
jgi:hypothetical protein